MNMLSEFVWAEYMCIFMYRFFPLFKYVMCTASSSAISLSIRFFFTYEISKTISTHDHANRNQHFIFRQPFLTRFYFSATAFVACFILTRFSPFSLKKFSLTRERERGGRKSDAENMAFTSIKSTNTRWNNNPPRLNENMSQWIGALVCMYTPPFR